jgi:hypothetical protein
MTDDDSAQQQDATGENDWWFDEPRSREPRAPGSRSLRTWIAAGAGALVLAAGVAAGVAALSSDDSLADATAGNSASGAFGGMRPGQAGMPGGAGTAGRIERVDGTSFTMKTAAGESVDVTTSDSTSVVEATSGSLDDLATDDRVVVIGGGSGDEITAMRIIAGDDQLGGGPPGGGGPANGGAPQGAPQSGGAPDGDAAGPGGAPQGAPNGFGAPVRGVITSVDGSTLEVELDDGSTVTVHTASDTDVRVMRERAVSDLAVGDQVMVIGENNDGNVTATTIRVGAADAPSGGPTGAPPAGGGGARSGTRTV